MHRTLLSHAHSRDQQAFDRLESGKVLKVEADDPAAEEDIQRWAKRVGHTVVGFEKGEGGMTFWIRKK